MGIEGPEYETTELYVLARPRIARGDHVAGGE